VPNEPVKPWPGLFSAVAPAALLDEMAEIAAGARPAAIRRTVLEVAACDTRDLLPRIRVPTLLLWGAEDARSPLEVADQFQAAIPSAGLVVIPGAGHMSNWEQPARFNAAIRGSAVDESPPDPRPPDRGRPKRPLRLWPFGRFRSRSETSERHYAGAIYGTLLVMALLAVEPEDDPPEKVAATVAGTMLAFWLAHVYAHTLATRLRAGVGPSWAHLREEMAHEWPLVQSALPALGALLLAAAGLFATGTAIAIGLTLGMVELFAWGVVLGRRQGVGYGRAILVGAIDCSFGLVIVVLETLVH
jgi:hypothetical protein